MNDLQTCLNLIEFAQEGEIFDISEYCNMVTHFMFIKTELGYEGIRIFHNSKELSTKNLGRPKGHEYFKTLNGCKKFFLNDFGFCYFDKNGNKKSLFIGEVEVIGLMEAVEKGIMKAY